ncbi:hypothetical protein, partial [Rugosimonospora africana]|uniref:hypothetical protein n=1 Tax=Rugosimonospora africana TaxID=556532 RepID=UPI00194380D0
RRTDCGAAGHQPHGRQIAVRLTANGASDELRRGRPSSVRWNELCRDRPSKRVTGELWRG